MSSNAASGSETPAPAKSSPVRLAVLLGLLGIVVIMLLVDLLVFKPAAEKAQVDLQAAAEAKMKQGVTEENGDKKQHYFLADDVYKIIGRKPSWERSKDDHVIQTFAWWGYIPLNRHRFDVLFRKTKDGNLIYESQDGHIDFSDIAETQIEHLDLPTREDPVASEGGEPMPELDNTVPESTDPTPPAEITDPAAPPTETNPVPETDPAPESTDSTETPKEDSAEEKKPE